MVRLSAAVMAHPARKDFVDETLNQLDRFVPVAWDNEGPPSSSPQRRWRTGRRAWEMYDPDADWHMVLQDDLLVSRDLLSGLERALDHLPEQRGIVQPYVGTKRPAHLLVQRMARDARSQNASWVKLGSLFWGVAIIAQTETIPDMMEWCDFKTSMPYDMRVGRFYRDVLHEPTWYTWPSLVDHRRSPSLIAHSDAGRHAYNFYGGSALDLDWSGPVVSNEPVSTGSPTRRSMKRTFQSDKVIPRTNLKRPPGMPLNARYEDPEPVVDPIIQKAVEERRRMAPPRR